MTNIDKALKFVDGGCPRSHCEKGTCEECSHLQVLADAYRELLSKLEQIEEVVMHE